MSACELDGCERQPGPSRKLCAMHRKRRERGRPLDAPTREARLATREETLANLAVDLANVDSENDAAYEHARLRLMAHASAGWGRFCIRCAVAVTDCPSTAGVASISHSDAAVSGHSTGQERDTGNGLATPPELVANAINN